SWFQNQGVFRTLHVSTIMGRLEKMGVISRERRKIEEMQDRGVAVYFIKPYLTCTRRTLTKHR
ncbi:hypothetical protein AD944_00390, partial [Acetobacter tropicalis]